MEFLPYDEETMAKMKKAAEERQERSNVAIHAMVRLLGELSQEDMEALGSLVSYIANRGRKAPQAASYWQGMIAARLHERFGLCSGCGENHDAALAEMAGEVQEEAPTPQPVQPVLQNGPMPISWTPKGSKEPLGDAEANIMRLHDLQENRKPDGTLIDFICKGCGRTYISIQDRTLMPVGPTGCSGCLLKTKWG